MRVIAASNLRGKRQSAVSAHVLGLHSIVVSSTPAMLAGKVDFGVHDALRHVSGIARR